MITAAPEDVGLDPQRLARVDDMTHRYVDEGRLPCVQTVVARRGQVVHHDVYGWADVDERRRLEPDAVFRIYSMTKPLTSILLMQLVETGEVLLEQPVSRWVPGFADTQVWAGGTEDDPRTTTPAREMTVHDVLTHQSGLTAGFQQDPVAAQYRSTGLDDLLQPTTLALGEWCDRLAELPLLFSPGDAWAYGVSTEVAARVVEVAVGKPFDDVLRERILEPLGMADTGFWVPPERIDRLVSSYVRHRGALVRIDGREGSRYAEPPSFLSGAHGLVSTAADYQRFVQALARGGELDGERIIGHRTLAYMASNHLPGGATLNERGQATFSEASMEGTGFGLGFSVVLDPAANRSLATAGEYGWGGAASTAFWVDPVEELTCVFLTQLLPSTRYPIRRQLRNAVNQAIVD